MTRALLFGWAAAFLATAILDALALGLVIGPFVEARVGTIMRASPDLLAAAIFYLGYPLAILRFAARGRAPGRAAVEGALLGLACYGVYESTNMATLQGWRWEMVALDTAWGAIVTAAGAAAASAAMRGAGRPA